jgi:chemotaxis protein histidine kinase CheA/ActR/RegA family two-component response regulator
VTPTSEEIRKRFIGKFRSTALERVARANTAFGALEQGRGDEATADLLMRELHTLKGESHIMGFLDVNEIAHVTEDILIWVRGRDFRVESSAIDLVYLGLDLIQAHVAEERDEEALAPRRAALLEAGRALLDGVGAPPAERHGAPAPRPEPVTGEPSGEPEAPARPIGRGLGDILRVPGETVGRITNLTSELMLRQESLVRELNALWSTLRAGAAARATEPVKRLRALREQVFESSLMLEDLQSTVHRIRLLQISALFDRYPAAIREIARSHGKRVRVVVRGGDVVGDKQVLDVIDQAILHLVRNSLDHGIETPEERVAAGKPEQGTITLAARQHGTRIRIVVRDNGRGLDADALRRVAIERGVIDEAEARVLDDDDARQLVFRPGFSTRDEASQMSGRGVGLDVVREQVGALGGSIELVTTRGRGTSFTLELPTSVVMTRIFTFRCGEVAFGLASANIDRVFRAAAERLERAGAGYAIDHEGERIPIADMRVELGSRDAGDAGVVEVVVVHHAGQRIGLAVDSFLGERQVVQRSLGNFLAGMRMLSGAVVLDTGEVTLLLSIAEIVRRWGEGDTRLVHALPAHVGAEAPWRVLIVDDSELTRDMLVGVAQRGHFTVDEAVNGREGLARMHANRPDLVLTDLDMPVMNGFEFIGRVRSEPAFEGIPIIVMTTRGSEEDKRRAMVAGANDYIIKSGFNQQKLHEILARLLDSRTA